MAVQVLLFRCCCSGAAVQVLLFRCCCSGAAVQVLLFRCCCSGFKILNLFTSGFTNPEEHPLDGICNPVLSP
jgi:hypothetical protein